MNVKKLVVSRFPSVQRLGLAASLVPLSPFLGEPHDLGIIRVELVEERAARYRLEVKLPPVLALEVEEPELPPRCRPAGPPVILRRPTLTVMRFEMDCRGEPLTPEDRLRLPWKREGAFVRTRWLDGSAAGHFFGETAEGVEVALGALKKESRPAAEAVRHYFLLGVEHILRGWDHLAFVLGLCLIASGLPLVKLVTAFTVGHSLTLALAVLGVVNVPIAPVEACIALSIALVARQAAGGVPAAAHGARLAFAFGLLHGLGFASALARSGIGRPELLLGLPTFNVGVEVGQLIFVAAVVVVLGLSRGLSSALTARRVTAYFLGILAVFWSLERVLAFRTLTP